MYTIHIHQHKKKEKENKEWGKDYVLDENYYEKP